MYCWVGLAQQHPQGERTAAVGRFDGRVAIITDGSRGIGLAVARRIVDEGGRVVITARDPEVLDRAVDNLGGESHALAVAGKAQDTGHRAQTIECTLATFGRIDVLVNNTGVNP